MILSLHYSEGEKFTTKVSTWLNSSKGSLPGSRQLTFCCVPMWQEELENPPGSPLQDCPPCSWGLPPHSLMLPNAHWELGFQCSDFGEHIPLVSISWFVNGTLKHSALCSLVCNWALLHIGTCMFHLLPRSMFPPWTLKPPSSTSHALVLCSFIRQPCVVIRGMWKTLRGKKKASLSCSQDVKHAPQGHMGRQWCSGRKLGEDLDDSYTGIRAVKRNRTGEKPRIG